MTVLSVLHVLFRMASGGVEELSQHYRCRGERTGRCCAPHECGRDAERIRERRIPEVTDDGEPVSHVMHEQPFPFVGIRRATDSVDRIAPRVPEAHAAPSIVKPPRAG